MQSFDNPSPDPFNGAGSLSAKAGIPICEQPANLLAVLRSAEVTQALHPDILRRITSDFATLAKLTDTSRGKEHRWTKEEIDQQLVKLPADPMLLRPILERVLPARLRIKAKRWSTIQSSVSRCLELTDWIDGDDILNAPLTPQWASLCATVRGDHFISNLMVFARFCSRNHIAPDEVNESTVEQFRAWRQKRTRRHGIGESINALRYGWNQRAGIDAGWPSRRLNPPPDPRHYVFEDKLSPAYIAWVDEYIGKLRTHNPLDPIFFRKFADATILQRKRVLLRAPSILIASGQSAASITGPGDVLKPDPVRTVLMDLFHRLGEGKAWPSSAVYTIGTLRAAARYVAATDPTIVSSEDLAQLDSFRKLVRVDARRLSHDTRERLAALETPDMERRFRMMSDECFARADEHLAAGKPAAAAHLHKAALALAILICKPLRRKNLAELDFHRHFRRDSRGRIIEMRVPAREVHKSQVDIEACLSPQLAARIEKHWSTYRPLIVSDRQASALFANDKGRPLNPNTLASSVINLVGKWIGIEFNLHLVRHWAASVLFDEDPRNGPLVQSLLGQMNPASSSKYGSRRTRAAHRRYTEILESRMKRRKKGDGR
jgi:integrase